MPQMEVVFRTNPPVPSCFILKDEDGKGGKVRKKERCRVEMARAGRPLEDCINFSAFFFFFPVEQIRLNASHEVSD